VLDLSLEWMVSKHYAFVAASGSSVIRSVGLSRVWVVVSSIASGRIRGTVKVCHIRW